MKVCKFYATKSPLFKVKHLTGSKFSFCKVKKQSHNLLPQNINKVQNFELIPSLSTTSKAQNLSNSSLDFIQFKILTSKALFFLNFHARISTNPKKNLETVCSPRKCICKTKINASMGTNREWEIPGNTRVFTDSPILLTTIRFVSIRHRNRVKKLGMGALVICPFLFLTPDFLGNQGIQSSRLSFSVFWAFC